MERNTRFVLASSSPRRRRILETLGFDCIVAPASLEEHIHEHEHPDDYVQRVAREKLHTVRPNWPDNLVIAADTIVVLGRSILAKPYSPADARTMLEKLSGRWHTVQTAIALGNENQEIAGVSTTLVKFRILSKAEIGFYVDTGESLDKAGSYGIQGLGAALVEKIEGSCSNVAGFPVEMFLALVEELLGPPWTRFAITPRPDLPK